VRLGLTPRPQWPAKAFSATRPRGEPCLSVLSVLPARRAILLQLHAVRVIALVLETRIIPAAALSARPPETSIVDPASPRHSDAPFPVGQEKPSQRPSSAPAGSTTRTLPHSRALVKAFRGQRTPGCDRRAWASAELSSRATRHPRPVAHSCGRFAGVGRFPAPTAPPLASRWSARGGLLAATAA